jgi:hypothetical protein
VKVRRLDWVALPTKWIEDGGLQKFRWRAAGGQGTAALVLLVVLAHHADQDNGLVRMTYDTMSEASGLSRAMIAAALALLIKRKRIARAPEIGRSVFQLQDFDKTVQGWGKVPARGLYTGPRIPAFAALHLRSIVELDAMKIYLLFVARRNIKTNYVNLTYAGIEDYTGIARDRIRAALSLLAALYLVHIDHIKSTLTEHGMANAYRLVHLEAYKHMGTTGRALEADDFIISD